MNVAVADARIAGACAWPVAASSPVGMSSASIGAPLAFEIHYREGGTVLAPVVRDASSADSGTFEAREPRDYCAWWEAGASGAIISYRLLLRAAPP